MLVVLLTAVFFLGVSFVLVAFSTSCLSASSPSSCRTSESVGFVKVQLVAFGVRRAVTVVAGVLAIGVVAKRRVGLATWWIVAWRRRALGPYGGLLDSPWN